MLGTVTVIVINVVVVSFVLNLSCDRMIAMPVIKMTRVPVIPPVGIMPWPVSTDTHKNISAMIIRINPTKSNSVAEVIADPERELRPDYPMDQAMASVPVNVAEPRPAMSAGEFPVLVNQAPGTAGFSQFGSPVCIGNHHRGVFVNNIYLTARPAPGPLNISAATRDTVFS
jgi:hypothetical protein